MLAEHCSYGVLHDELIRDRLIVGLSDAQLLECMQLDRDLTLEKAITMVQQSEEVKRPQSSLCEDPEAEVKVEIKLSTGCLRVTERKVKLNLLVLIGSQHNPQLKKKRVNVLDVAVLSPIRTLQTHVYSNQKRPQSARGLQEAVLRQYNKPE